MRERQKLFNELSRSAHAKNSAITDVFLDEIITLRAQVAALTEHRQNWLDKDLTAQVLLEQEREIITLTAALGKARRVLEINWAVFRGYSIHHAAKGDSEKEAKNLDFALTCERTVDAIDADLGEKGEPK